MITAHGIELIDLGVLLALLFIVTKMIPLSPSRAQRLIRVVRDWRADMIVMGIRSRTGMIQGVFGRTSDLVRRNAPCEVIPRIGSETQTNNSRVSHDQVLTPDP